jgi:hypothetical protein
MSDVADSARALVLRLMSRRWDDPPRTVASVDATIAQLEQLRAHSRDADDAVAIRESLEAAADVRRELRAASQDARIDPA